MRTSAARCLTIAGASLAVSASPAWALPLFGLNDGPHAHEQGTDAVLDLHQRLGSDVLRLSVQWRVVEPSPGERRWGLYEQDIRAAAARGLETIVTVGSAPAWAAPPPRNAECREARRLPDCHQPPAPAHLDAFRRFVADLVARFPSVTAVEVFNEPNIGSHNWQPAADPEYYVEVARAAVRGAKEARRAVRVVSGGVALLPEPKPEGALDPIEFVRRVTAAGGGGLFDGIGLHPYPGPLPADDPRAVPAFSAAVRNAAGPQPPDLWFTETGYTSTGSDGLDEPRQAAMLGDLVRYALRQDRLAAVVVHTLVDLRASSPFLPQDADSAERERIRGFGLLRTSFTPKPAFEAVRAAVREVRAETARARATAARREAAAEQRRARRTRKGSCPRTGQCGRLVSSRVSPPRAARRARAQRGS